MRFMHSALLVSVIAGCSSRTDRVYPPDIDPAAAGKAAMDQYDSNGDGAVAGDELKRAAALASALENLDVNQDGKVAADEIAARVETWKASNVGLMGFHCIVTLDGVPVVGAEVQLEPESFMGGAVQPAGGTTDSEGVASMSIAPENRPEEAKTATGMQPGFYLVRIGPAGMIPERYNTAGALGCEVAEDAAGASRGMRFELISN